MRWNLHATEESVIIYRSQFTIGNVPIIVVVFNQNIDGQIFGFTGKKISLQLLAIHENNISALSTCC